MGQGSGPACRYLVAGDRGLVVEFGDVVDAQLNAYVIALDTHLRATPIAGLVETIPTYRSLLVVFDPATIPRALLAERLRHLVSCLRPEAATTGRRWIIPVAYGGPFGADLDSVAALHDLGTEEVIRLHAGAAYRVYMIGFAPGFAYLGGLPEALHTARRTDPRPRTPAGSVSIGGVQAAVTSVEIPSGWHLLGRTPLRTFDLRRDDPFLLKPGDEIRFRVIDATEYDRLLALAEAGTIKAELEAVA